MNALQQDLVIDLPCGKVLRRRPSRLFFFRAPLCQHVGAARPRLDKGARVTALNFI